jgi:hypothetical protein
MDYSNIDFRINTLYDATYNNENSLNYRFDLIVKNDIKLINIKEPSTYNLDHVLSEKIEYIGKYNKKYVFERNSDKSYPCILTIGKYNSKNLNYNELTRGELFNPSIHYILSELVIMEKIPHILLPILFCDLPDDKVKNFDILKKEKPNIKYYIFCTEKYFKMMTLKEFIQSEYKFMTTLHWQVLFFQVFYTLIKITERLEKFRHNNLNLDAIRVYKKKKMDKPISYKIGITQFEIPDLGFEIKFTDFENSCAGNYIKNRDTDKYVDNPYYDMHYFTCSVYIFLLSEYKEIVNKDLENLINIIVPQKFMPNLKDDFIGLNEKEFDANSSQIIVPLIILKKNIFFNKFIVEPMNLSVSPVENKGIKIERLKNKKENTKYLSSDNYKNNKKKSKQYYNKDKMFGSRKLIVSEFSESENSVSLSELHGKKSKSLFSRTESYKSESDSSKEKRKKSKSRKYSKKQSRLESDSQSGGASSDTPSLTNSDSSDSSSTGSSSTGSSSTGSSSAGSSSTGSRSPDASSSASGLTSSSSNLHGRKSDRSSLSSKSDIESLRNKLERLKSGSKNTGKINKVDSEFANKLNKLPHNFIGDVPPHIIQQLNGNATLSPGQPTEMQMMMGNSGIPPQQPIVMSPQQPIVMSPQQPIVMSPQQMMIPSQQPTVMSPQQQMSSMDMMGISNGLNNFIGGKKTPVETTLGVPMLGGGKNKYSFIGKNRKKLNKTDVKDDFFF